MPDVPQQGRALQRAIPDRLPQCARRRRARPRRSISDSRRSTCCAWRAVGLAGAAGVRPGHGLLPRLPRRRQHASRGNSRELLRAQVRELERATGSASAARAGRCCVSVRSGAAVSMPGMMETMLDVGLNDATCTRPAAPHRQSAPGLGLATAGWCSPSPKSCMALPAARSRRALGERLREARVASRSATSISQALQRLDRRLSRGCSRTMPGSRSRRTRSTSSRRRSRRCSRSWQRAEGARRTAGCNGLADEPRHGGHGASDGVRQRRRHIRRRRRLHARSRDRRAGALPRLPVQRAGRGRRLGAARRARCRAVDRSVLPAAGRRSSRASPRASSTSSATCRNSSSRSRTAACIILQTRTGKRSAWAALRIAVDQVGEGLIDPQGALERLAAPRAGTSSFAPAWYERPARASVQGGGREPGRGRRGDRARSREGGASRAAPDAR